MSQGNTMYNVSNRCLAKKGLIHMKHKATMSINTLLVSEHFYDKSDQIFTKKII